MKTSPDDRDKGTRRAQTQESNKYNREQNTTST